MVIVPLDLNSVICTICSIHIKKNQLKLTFLNISFPVEEEAVVLGGSAIGTRFIIALGLFLLSILLPWSSSCWFSSSFSILSRLSSCCVLALLMLLLLALEVGGLVRRVLNLKITNIGITTTAI